jgi:hypothetical protein
MYQYQNGNWAVKNDFEVLDVETLTENINYIFDSTVEIVLRVQDYKKAIKSKTTKYYYEVVLKGTNIPLFKKADKESDILIVIPNDCKKVNTRFLVRGLKDDNEYWYVQLETGKEFYDGYITSDNVES